MKTTEPKPAIYRLGDAVEFRGGGTPSRAVPDYWNGDIPWASVKDFKGITLDRTQETITSEGLQNCASNLIPAGTVIIPTRMALGKAAIATMDVAINQDLRAVFPKIDLDPRYLLWFFIANARQLESLGEGATVKGITQDKLYAMKIPVPKLADQRRLAALLDRADALRRKRQDSLRLADEFLRSVFLDMFNSKSSESWPSVTVGQLVDQANGSIRTGPFGSQLLHSEFVDSGIAVLGIDNVVNNVFEWGEARYITKDKYNGLKRYTVNPGDVLITLMGTVGRCAVAPEGLPEAINTKHLCCMTLNRAVCHPEFLHSYFLLHPVSRSFLTQRSKGAIMDGLNMAIIKELPVRLPFLRLQNEFVTIKLKVGEQVREMLEHEKLTSILLSSIQHRAFAGEL